MKRSQQEWSIAASASLEISEYGKPIFPIHQWMLVNKNCEKGSMISSDCSKTSSELSE
jgi:hypothetical protein